MCSIRAEACFCRSCVEPFSADSFLFRVCRRVIAWSREESAALEALEGSSEELADAAALVPLCITSFIFF